MQKICDNCKKTFSTNRIDQRFCSADCRTKWHNHHDPERSYAAYMERKKKAAIKHRGYALEDLTKQVEKTTSDVEALVKKAEKLQRKAARAKHEQEKKEKIIADLFETMACFEAIDKVMDKGHQND